MKKDTKESPWPFFQPASFRHWTKRKMTPLPVDRAMKGKYKASMLYLLTTVATFHYIIYKHFWKEDANKPATVQSDINPLFENMIALSPQKNVKGTLYTFEDFKLKSIETYDPEDQEERRRNS